MHESGEMYLETILVLGKRNNIVHAVDIAREMDLAKPSVSRALGKLKKEECIIVDHSGRIAFTEKGREIAEKIYERHNILTRALIALGIDEQTASEDACKIEHDISDDAFEAIKKHFSYTLSGANHEKTLPDQL